MKTQQTMPRRTFTVELDPDSKKLQLCISVFPSGEEPKRYFQSWNLEVVPFEDAMSQCIHIIYPQRVNVQPQSLRR